MNCVRFWKRQRLCPVRAEGVLVERLRLSQIAAMSDEGLKAVVAENARELNRVRKPSQQPGCEIANHGFARNIQTGVLQLARKADKNFTLGPMPPGFQLLAITG